MSRPEDPEKKRARGIRYRAEKKADPEWMARERVAGKPVQLDILDAAS